MSDEYRIIKLSFHLNIKTPCEWHSPNFDQEYIQKMSLKLDSHLPKKIVNCLIESPLKLMKKALFYLKSSFRSPDI